MKRVQHRQRAGALKRHRKLQRSLSVHPPESLHGRALRKKRIFPQGSLRNFRFRGRHAAPGLYRASAAVRRHHRHFVRIGARLHFNDRRINGLRELQN